MFQQLMEIIQSQSQELVVNNPQIPNEHNHAVMEEAGVSITQTLQKMMASGQAKDVLGMFNSDPQQLNQLGATQQVSQNFMGSLMEKFGLNNQMAAGLAGSLIPSILGNFIGKAKNPNDSSLNVQDIFNGLSGNRTSGLDMGSLLSKFSGGLDKDGDGDTDLSDLTAMFSGNSNTGAGGMLDQLKGMFKA